MPHYKTNKYTAYEEHELGKLAPVLQTADQIIGYNIKDFDFEVLKPYLNFDINEVPCLDLLAEIDTPELNQELSQARAQLAQAEAALALARTTDSRWAELLKSSSVSEQEAAEKKADLELKSATVEAAHANVRRLEELQSFERVTAPFAGTITARGRAAGASFSAWRRPALCACLCAYRNPPHRVWLLGKWQSSPSRNCPDGSFQLKW